MTVNINYAAWVTSDTYDLSDLNPAQGSVVTRTYTDPETGVTTPVSVSTIDARNHVYAYTIGNEVTIGIRGTADLRDAAADTAIALGLTPERNEKIVEAITTYLDDHRNETITFTGHSLGGYEAAVMSKTFGFPAITFNAPAGPAIGSATNVWNISDSADVVGHFGGAFSWSGYPNRIDVKTDATAAAGPMGTHTMSHLIRNIQHSVGLISLPELLGTAPVQLSIQNSMFRMTGSYTDPNGVQHSVTTASTGDGMVQRRDWQALIRYGASFFMLEKLAAVVGTTNLHVYAAMRGQPLEVFLQTRNAPSALYSVASQPKNPAVVGPD